MDQAVLDALQRWPDVPAVYGWLSLDKRGRWRLHPDQGAAQAITNPQILAFMDRNYAADAAGCWFFQNGPQRVYVDLLGAPYILRLDDSARAWSATTASRSVPSGIGGWMTAASSGPRPIWGRGCSMTGICKPCWIAWSWTTAAPCWMHPRRCKPRSPCGAWAAGRR